MKVPYQYSDYKSVVMDGSYLLVDKTKYIEVLEDVGKQLLFLRPRRFGKSFFLSMLQCYYDIREKENFEKLFGGTYIYDHKTAYANSYHVLKFDFSSISATRESAMSSFSEEVSYKLRNLIDQEQLPIELADADEPNRIFNSFL
ncbi:MAG: AAA family ATPase, partial [Lachnospiraceae bacterium]|nr:AAA family ATPase [Lachnospiraceae bacterium]